MKYSYEPLDLEFKVKKSPLIKYVAIFIALIFMLIPLPEISHEYDYNRIESEMPFTCIVGYDFYAPPLEYRELKSR